MEQEEFIIEVLDLFKSKLKNGTCAKSQSDAVYNVIAENLDLFATADEIADHYGKSRDAVHSIIKNKMFEKPKRNITLYNFKAFAKLIPSSWRKKR